MTQRMTKKLETDEDLKGPTIYLVLVNIIFYVLSTIIGGNLLLTGPLAIVLLGFSIKTFFAGLIWTPVTSIFAHASIAHIGGNMIFLLVYGFNMEERGYKDEAIYLAYFVTGILSTIVAAPIIGASTISLGASGAIFGILGVNTGIERREGSANYRNLVLVSIIVFITSTSANTNIFAHFFGLIFGIILGNSQFFAKFKEEEQS